PRDAQAHGRAAKARRHQDRRRLGSSDPLLRAGQQPHQGPAHQRRDLRHPKSAGRRPRPFHRSISQTGSLTMSALREGPTTVVRREDYAPPAYWIDTVELVFDLDPAKTRVLNRMTLRRNADVAAQPLRLDGEELNLARVLVNGAGCSFR